MRYFLTFCTALIFMTVSPSKVYACGGGQFGNVLMAPLLTALNALPPQMTEIRIQQDDRLKIKKFKVRYERLCEVNTVIADITQALTMMCDTIDIFGGLLPNDPMAMAITGHLDNITGGLNNMTTAMEQSTSPNQFMGAFGQEATMIGNEFTQMQQLLPVPQDTPQYYWYRTSPSELGGKCHGGGPWIP